MNTDKKNDKKNEMINPEVLPHEPVIPPSMDKYRAGTNFYGSKRKMIEEIYRALAIVEPKTILEPFAGTGIISFVLKYNGARMISSDIRLHSYMRLRCLIKNQTTTLSESEVDMLVSKPRKKKKLTYPLDVWERFISEGNSQFLQNLIERIPQLEGKMKQDIARYIVVHCISTYFKFAAIHFNWAGYPTGDCNLTEPDLAEDVREYALHIFPSLVFSNRQKNKVYQEDAVKLISRSQADAVILDSPYATWSRGGGEYEGCLAFLDDMHKTLAGRGREIKDPTDSKAELPNHDKYNSRNSALIAFGNLFRRCRHIPAIVITYNDRSDISPNVLCAKADSAGWKVSMEQYQSRLSTTGKNSPNNCNEYIISCYNEEACKKLSNRFYRRKHSSIKTNTFRTSNKSK